MKTRPKIKPLASMQEAWDEHDRLRALYYHLAGERDRLWDESVSVVVLTARKFHEPGAVIDWLNHTVTKAQSGQQDMPEDPEAF